METLTLDDVQQGTIAGALAHCPLFRALKPELIPQILKVAEVRHFAPGETILRQGDPSDSFFVIVEGETSVRVRGADGETTEIGRMPLRASVGEVGLLLGEPRTATVVAIEPVTAVRFGAPVFETMFQKIPGFGVAVAQGLAHRLQEVSSRIPLPEWDEPAPPDGETLALLPFDFCQRHRVLPLLIEGATLTVGFVDDPTPHVMAAIHDLAPSMDVKPVRVKLRLYDEVMRSYAGVPGWTGAGEGDVLLTEQPPSASPRLDAMLQRVVAEGASDLHLAAHHKPHWRISGDMQVIGDAPPLGREEAFELLAPVMEERHREAFIAENDVDFAYSLPGGARFRVNVFRDRHGVGAALRQIPSRVLSLEQLGMPPVLKTLSEMPKGLVLVTGPTGSGKSTTLAAMIDYINRSRKAHIVTLEDPIEFVHESASSLVNQREIYGHTTSFARALKAVLREDPNVVLVGEMRDLETISLALETANTGHLVFATLHTNSAISTVDRIVDQFPAAQQEQIRSVLADVLRGVVAQTLVKKIGGGRLAVVEILVSTFAVANLIRENKTVQIPSVMQASKGLGMTTLNDELGKLVEAKKIELDEALSKAVDKDDLLRRFRSGVTLAADPSPDRFRVMLVRPDSPGAVAGLQRGDLVVEINEQPVTGRSLEEMRQIFRTEGTYKLTIERGGKRLKPLTFELKGRM